MRDSIILGTSDDISHMIFPEYCQKLKHINLALFIDIALSAELNFNLKFIFKFLSIPFTKVKYI